MLNYEPQTHVITSEAPQFFVLLSDLSKILDVRTLHSLKKDSTGKDIFEKGQKKVAIFSGRCARTTCTPPVAPLVSNNFNKIKFNYPK